MWDRLDLDRFWGPRLTPSRQGTRWLDILKIQVCYRLIDPGSEWRLHRHWYEHSALRDLLGCDRAIADDTLYRCLDKLLAHKQDFFSFLRARWATLFDARFDVLLYDLTSTYFESDPPHPDKRRFGYSRDKRSDCVQVVIALIVTPDGFPLAYEVMPGNTADQTTLAEFLEKIERQYGRSGRIWIMDRSIPTEETLASMREGDAPVRYPVGTPKGRLTRLEKAVLDLPWQEVRRSVDVKLLAEDGELYVLVCSEGRLLKERGMRRRRLKKLWRRLGGVCPNVCVRRLAGKRSSNRIANCPIAAVHSMGRRHPDGVRAPVDHRRTVPRPAAPHPAEQGARATAASARHDPAATARAADLRLTAHAPPFGGRITEYQWVRTLMTPELRKSG